MIEEKLTQRAVTSAEIQQVKLCALIVRHGFSNQLEDVLSFDFPFILPLRPIVHVLFGIPIMMVPRVRYFWFQHRSLPVSCPLEKYHYVYSRAIGDPLSFI